MYDFYIVHATPLKNLAKIIRYGYLFTQLSRKKLNESNIVIGEGSEIRTLCHPMTTLVEIQQNDCDEAIGVYFRVYPTLKSIPPPKRGNAQIILHGSILQHYDWHVNYCENNGIFIREGEKAYFGDETKDCFPSEMKKVDLSKIDTDDSEIIVYSDVNILQNSGKYLQDIRTKKIDEKTKKYVAQHHIWMKYFVANTLKNSKSSVKYTKRKMSAKVSSKSLSAKIYTQKHTRKSQTRKTI